MYAMEKTRKIQKVIKSKLALEGAGVHLKRAFGFGEVTGFDPFLLLDDFRSDTPEHYLKGFPWHPHRGIETITYILNGKVEHGDSMGREQGLNRPRGRAVDDRREWHHPPGNAEGG
jgi:redox-sensitive bicupin YhaK (pirin superfamily)